MKEQHDDRWVRSVASGADPLHYSEGALDDIATELRLDVRQRIAEEGAPSAADAASGWSCPQDGRKRITPSIHSPWMAAAVVMVAALMVGYAGLAVVLPDPAWAVDQTSDGLVRVELSSVLGRGPNPAGLVEELGAAGVSVEAKEQKTWWPLHSGRIIGIGWHIDVMPEAFADGQISLDADLSDVGIVEHGDAGFVIDPEVFTGTVYVNIGDTPW